MSTETEALREILRIATGIESGPEAKNVQIADIARASLASAEERKVVVLPRELPLHMIDAALQATAVHHDIPGTQLQVNREKMRLRYAALIAAFQQEETVNDHRSDRGFILQTYDPYARPAPRDLEGGDVVKELQEQADALESYAEMSQSAKAERELMIKAAALIKEMRKALEDAQPHLCSFLCPSVWKTADGPPPHHELCRRARALAAPGTPKDAL